jgi:hypothetical protein
MMKEDDDVKVALIPGKKIEEDFSTNKKTARIKSKTRCKTSCCCKVICFISLALFGLFLLPVIVGLVWGYRFVKHEVIRFTVPDPMELPNPVALPEAECEVIKDRSKLFFDAIVAGQEPDDDLSISEEQLNGCLVAHSDYLRGNFLLSIADNTMEVKTSLSTDFLPGGTNRYLVAHGNAQIETNEDNVSNTLSINLDTYKSIDGIDGPLSSAAFDMYEDDFKRFVMNILRGNFLNWIVPQDYIDEKENILEEFYHDPQMGAFLRGIKEISFSEEGFITILARRGDEDKVEISPDSLPKSNGSSRRILRRLLF